MQGACIALFGTHAAQIDLTITNPKDSEDISREMSVISVTLIFDYADFAFTPAT